MICKNKTFKLIVRYTKEKGLFTEFKKNIKMINNTFGVWSWNDSSTKSALKDDTRHILSILRYLNFKGERDEYNMESSKYIFQLYKTEIIKEFENLLEINKVKQEYYNNISKDFIKRYIFNLKITKDKKSFVYENLTPQGFIMYGFQWEKTKQGHRFWQQLNAQWEKLLYELIEKIANNE